MLLVALRKESVDRNIGPLIFNVQPRVALRKESVDRNCYFPSGLSGADTVALRKESVDRNIVSAFDVLAISGRSPQGERG